VLKLILLDLDYTLHYDGVLYDDSIRFLTFLRQHGYMIGILSMGDNTERNMIVDRLGLRKHIDFVWTCNLKTMDVFFKLLKHFNIKPHQVAYIGDNEEHDFDSANKMGILTIKVCRGIFTNIKMLGTFRASIETNNFIELESMLKPKSILLIPERNSIVSTAINILKYHPTMDITASNFDSKIHCNKYDCVLPCGDNELETLSLINLGNILISELKTIVACRNKNKFKEVFNKEDYYPNPVKTKKVVFKPIYGSGSKDIVYDIYKKEQKGYTSQQFINGEEYTVDCLFVDNDLKNMAIRERHFVWNGLNTLSVFKPEHENKIRPIIEHISTKLKFNGLINIQFIKDKKGKFWLTEINARACSNMCYGGNNNFILNAVIGLLGKTPQYGKINTRGIDRWMSWEEY